MLQRSLTRRSTIPINESDSSESSSSSDGEHHKTYGIREMSREREKQKETKPTTSSGTEHTRTDGFFSANREDYPVFNYIEQYKQTLRDQRFQGEPIHSEAVIEDFAKDEMKYRDIDINTYNKQKAEYELGQEQAAEHEQGPASGVRGRRRRAGTEQVIGRAVPRFGGDDSSTRHDVRQARGRHGDAEQRIMEKLGYSPFERAARAKVNRVSKEAKVAGEGQSLDSLVANNRLTRAEADVSKKFAKDYYRIQSGYGTLTKESVMSGLNFNDFKRAAMAKFESLMTQSGQVRQKVSFKSLVASGILGPEEADAIREYKNEVSRQKLQNVNDFLKE